MVKTIGERGSEGKKGSTTIRERGSAGMQEWVQKYKIDGIGRQESI